MSQKQPDTVANFYQELERQEASQLTIRNYRSDLSHFSRWFEGSLGESFSPTVVTPTDIRDYRAHLVTVEKRQPATVNRRLAAVRKLFLWVKGQGLISELPTDAVKGMASVPRAPKWLSKREVIA